MPVKTIASARTSPQFTPREAPHVVHVEADAPDHAHPDTRQPPPQQMSQSAAVDLGVVDEDGPPDAQHHQVLGESVGLPRIGHSDATVGAPAQGTYFSGSPGSVTCGSDRVSPVYEFEGETCSKPAALVIGIEIAEAPELYSPM